MLIEANGNSVRITLRKPHKAGFKAQTFLNATTKKAMRLTAILLMAFVFQVSARGTAQTVTWAGKSVPLQQVFSIIHEQTGYHLFYRLEDVKDARAVTARFLNAPVAEVLKNVLEGQGLSFSIKGKTVFITRNGNATSAEEEALYNAPPPEEDLKGKILNEKGDPLAGAYIKLRGTSRATVTDNKGEFLLSNIDLARAELDITYIGYRPVRLQVGGRKFILMAMFAEAQQLDSAVISVVSTGYQTLPKERSAGSFAKPDMSILANRTGTMNVLQRLDGLVPGLTINNANTDNLQIRGLTSIGVSTAQVFGYVGTERGPLVVVDGIPISDISSVNPNDVGDITVLKDATAASIWGARAANGVIVITTKQGNRSGRFKVEYDGFANFMGRPNLDNMPVLSSSQYIQAVKDIFDPVTTNWATISIPTYAVSPGVSPHEQILYDWYRGLITTAAKDSRLDSLAGISNHDQIKDIFYRNALLTNHTISMRGGGEKYSFYGSLAYTYNQDSKPGTSASSYKINARQDYRPSRYVNLYLITDLTNSRSSAAPLPDANYRFLPYQLFKDAGGNNIHMPWLYRTDSVRRVYEGLSGVSLDYSPVDEAGYGYTRTDGLLARITAGLSINIWNGLKLEGTYGLIKGNSESRVYESENAYTTRREVVSFATGSVAANNIRYFMPNRGGRYTTSNTARQNYTVRHQLVYNKNWNNYRHQVTALAGTEVQEALTRGTSLLQRGFSPQLGTSQSLNYDTLNKGVVNTIMLYNSYLSFINGNDFTYTEVKSRFRSYYANLAYTLFKKYNLNASVRRDQSSLFGIDKSAQNKPVWSVGASWLLSEEGFINKVSWVNKLNLRATYGLAGNAPSPGTAASKDIISSSTSSVYPGGRAYTIAAYANRSLTWESTKVINLGLDFSLLNSRISGSVDYYQKNTQNLLGSLPTNGFTGVSTVIGNLGSLTNKGVELGLTTLNLKTKQFAWQTVFNFAYNKNKITRLATSLNATTGAAVITQNAYGGFYQGYAAYGIFAYDYAGLDNMGDPQIRLADKTVTKARNVTKPADMVFMGTYQPKWSGGFSNTFRYKTISLSVNTIYNLGHIMRRDVNTVYTTNRLYAASLTMGNTHADFANRWRQPGDEAVTDIPGWVSSTAVSTSRRDVNYYMYGSNNVVSASFIKVRDITLSYDLPKQVLRRLNSEGITVRVQMGNIMVWKANRFNIDPEFQDAVNGTRGQLANQHTFSVGLHVNL